MTNEEKELLKTVYDHVSCVMCDYYCKYPLIWDEETMGPMIEKVCEKCPLVKNAEFFGTKY